MPTTLGTKWFFEFIDSQYIELSISLVLTHSLSDTEWLDNDKLFDRYTKSCLYPALIWGKVNLKSFFFISWKYFSSEINILSAISLNTGAATSLPYILYLLGLSITTIQLYFGSSLGKNPANDV